MAGGSLRELQALGAEQVEFGIGNMEARKDKENQNTLVTRGEEPEMWMGCQWRFDGRGGVKILMGLIGVNNRKGELESMGSYAKAGIGKWT